MGARTFREVEGRFRRSGLNKPQLGTDAEAENGEARSDADFAGSFPFFVENAFQVSPLAGGASAVTSQLAPPLDASLDRHPYADRGRRAPGSSENYV